MAHIKPPFTRESAIEKVKLAQQKWNTRDPEEVAKAYTPDCIWRNRDRFIQGTAQITSFLHSKWAREKSYRLRKELFCHGGEHSERIAVQFFYEYQDASDSMRWKRCYGLEDWTFDAAGKMRKRMMSGNDVLLGRDGDGVGVSEEGIEGRWFADGVDVEDERVTAMLTERHL